jgi:CHAT domain-containing protein
MLELAIRYCGPCHIEARLYGLPQSYAAATGDALVGIHATQEDLARRQMRDLNKLIMEGTGAHAGEMREGIEAVGNFLSTEVLRKCMADLRRAPDDDLVMILDAGLADWPWEMARVGDRYLWQKFNLGRTLICAGDQDAEQPQDNHHGAARALIVLARPGDGSTGENEMESIRQTLAPHMEVRCIDECRADEFLAELRKNYTIIHVIGHAEQREGVTFIKMADRLVGSDDLTAIGAVHTQLMFCNTCESSAGTGDNCLAAVFGRLGVKNYIGTLWNISDMSARDTAVVFFRNIAAGHSTGASLTSARNEHLAKGSLAWANYVLYGDPRMKMVKSAE